MLEPVISAIAHLEARRYSAVSIGRLVERPGFTVVGACEVPESVLVLSKTGVGDSMDLVCSINCAHSRHRHLAFMLAPWNMPCLRFSA